MPLDTTKLHYQMLRKNMSGTSDEALSQLQEKIQESGAVAPGEPIAIFYENEENKGAYLAVPTSGITSEEEADGFIFLNKKQVEDRFEEDETVTTAALLDLDERVSGNSQSITHLEDVINNLDFGDLGDIVTTSAVTATGVNVGGINDGTTIPSGTSLTVFLKQLLTKELDWTPHAPTLTVTVKKGGSAITTQEVGTNIELQLSNTKTDGYFSSSFGANTNAGQTGGTVTYHITSGGTEGTTSASTYTLTSAVEGDYKVWDTMPYDEVTATSKGLTKNTGAATSVKIASGTASGSSKTVEVRYKIYYGTTSAATAADFASSISSADGVVSSSDKIVDGKTAWNEKTANGVTTLETDTNSPWKNNGHNFYVLTIGKIDDVRSASNPTNTDIKNNFVEYSSTVPVKAAGGSITTNYHLYFYTIIGGGNVELINLKINRTH